MGRNFLSDSAGSSGVGFWRGRFRCGWNRQTALRYFSGVVSGFTHHPHGPAQECVAALSCDSTRVESFTLSGLMLVRCKLKENETYEAF